MVQVQMAPGFVVNQQQEVPSKEKCKQEITALKAVIEQGMTDGSTITFERMSEQRPGMIPGDVVFKVKVKPHHQFTRRGNDLHMELTISLDEALLGFERQVVHLDNRVVTITETSVTGPYDTKKITGEGMPHRDVPSQKGDLYVKMKITFPPKLSDQQKNVVKTLFVV